MACVLMGEHKLKAASSNPEAPDKKVPRGSESSDELMVDSAAPSWGQNIQKMMICMMGKIDGTANEIDHGGQILGDKRQERGRRSQHCGRAEVDQEGHQRIAGKTSRQKWVR